MMYASVCECDRPPDPSMPALYRNILEFHRWVTLSRNQISLICGENSLSDYKYQWK